MPRHSKSSELKPDRLARILEVTRDLARPIELESMLYQVVDAAKELLDAEGGTVWQYLPGDHVLEMCVARGLDAIRIPADRGIVGECVRTRALINVPDCYADPRFDRSVDRDSGYRTRCMLTLPLLGHDDQLVGVLQVVNRLCGVFDAEDEVMASALAAQCAVALQRVRMTEQLLRSEKLRQEIEVAQVIQQGTLPKSTPAISGYDFVSLFRPADDTGGDIYDFVTTAQGDLMLLMGDATGHGIGAALSAIQVRAMLRMAQRMGAGLDETFRHINDQLVVDLPEDRFVTAFLGCLNPSQHVLRYHSGGQGPLLHFRVAGLECDVLAPTTFPFGAMPIAALRAPSEVALAPGDIFALISDGVFEYQDAEDRLFGEQAVATVLRQQHDRPLSQVLYQLQQALSEFARGAPQLDDITVVLIRRRADPAADPREGECKTAQRDFARSFDALAEMFAFIQQQLAACGAGESVLYAVKFTAEELFTNMVKYNSAGGGRIDLSIACDGSEILCRLTDPDSDCFDVTAAPDADIDMPVEQRSPGGLGLHLIRRLVDSIEYDYSGRRSRITFRKTLGSG
ncbi:MAG: SpoIIE family protein phosphatase [Lysobacteraceae bacterium]